MAPKDPVLVPAGTPKLQEWQDGETASLKFSTLIDADYGPSHGVVHQIVIFEPGDGEKIHSHGQVQTAYVLEGSGTLELDGRTLDLSPGDTVFIPEGTPHAWSAPDEKLRLFVTYNCDRFAEVSYHFAETA